MCAGDEESGKNGSWIKGGQRIGVGEGKTETAREWRKSLKRHDKTERGGDGFRTNKSLESESQEICISAVGNECCSFSKRNSSL